MVSLFDDKWAIFVQIGGRETIISHLRKCGHERGDFNITSK